MPQTNNVYELDYYRQSATGTDVISAEDTILVPASTGAEIWRASDYSDEQIQARHELTKDTIAEFLENKQDGWNGEGSCGISLAVVINTLNVINEMPGWVFNYDIEIVPEHDGRLAIEWHANRRTFAVFINETENATFIEFYGPNTKSSGVWELSAKKQIQTFFSLKRQSIATIYEL